ncbi:hypothetical protein HK103_000066 [Boothiomyces macroporosus]|uniref:Uncharacterized protein n=1 Tax=Boothiomyces macroporosus TaxID=261099 RepID=A0AAD5UP76_9FUNG|nr:hypothetical protein HK103_000066 [Boothiomyces macroporosus]
MKTVEILILGYGWQGKYVDQICRESGINVAATTTSGREETIPFKFDPVNSDPQQYKRLPSAKTVLITFPLPTIESAAIIMGLYNAAHGDKSKWILLGSTRAFVGKPWADRHGPVQPDARYNAEEAFLKLGGCVLNLAGLYGGSRQPQNWIPRVAPTKEALKLKTSLHLIHGLDVARLIVKVSNNFTAGQRWIVTDLRVYDWWELVLGYEAGERLDWVRELILESGCKAVPRPPDMMDRALDSKEVWKQFDMKPLESLFHPK